MDITDDSKKSFFKHVFNFEDESKAEILNILQYALLAIIPVILLNKSMSKYVPESDEKKGSLEITAEIILQVIVMFIGLLIIHRVITYIPTYSAVKYPDFHIVYIILAVLMITMSLQTKLGEKVNILIERIIDLWEGRQEKKKNKKGKNSQSNSSSGQQQSNSMMPTSTQMGNAAITQSLYTNGTAISSLPNDTTSSYSGDQQQMPNYNAMHAQQTTPLVGAASPSNNEGFGPMEPMAANAVLGGGSFGGW
jgi:hypothetical protein